MTTKCRFPITLLLAAALTLAACGGDDEDPVPPAGDTGPGPGSGSGDDSDPTYTIGGSVTGLTGSGLVISNNSSDELTIDASGSFTFGGELADGASYEVEIVSQPANPDGVCTVDDGSGTVDGADVENVLIECTEPFALVTVAPTDGDQNVSREVQPLLTFSAEVDGATALPENITLSSDAGEVTMSIDVAGDVITLTPDNILLPLTDYTLTVSTDVQGSAGERLLDAATTSFKTRDGTWGDDFEIDAAAGNANDAQIAFDQDGNALALWYQASGARTELWWNYYTAGTGWGTADLVPQSGADISASSPRLGFDADGNALAIWTQSAAAGVLDVWSSRFVPGSGWETPVPVETDPGEVLGTADLAVHDSGDAVAVWEQVDGTFVDVWSNHFEAGSGWSTAEIIDEVDHLVDNPRVAMDPDGNALAVWVQSDGNPVEMIWGRRYSQANGWNEPPFRISTSITSSGTEPRPAMDADGNAIVVWLQNSGLDRGIYGSFYSAAGGWEDPLPIKSAEVGQQLEQPGVAFDPDGSAFAIWEHPVNTGGAVTISVFASRFTPGAGWDTPEVVSHADAFYPKIAIDPSGHALAVWVELDVSLPINQGYSVWSNRYTAGSGWTAAEQVGSYGAPIGTFMPNLAVDRNGDALAIWTRAGEVRTNRFE